MESVKIWNWIVNLLILTLPFCWYMCYLIYKDIRKLNKKIEWLEKMLKHKEPRVR